MEPTKPVGEHTAPPASAKNGRSDRRRKWEMTSANVRYFLPKQGASIERPELGREITSEAEVLVEAFRTGQIFYTLVAWKAVPEMDDGAPKIIKEALKRS